MHAVVEEMAHGGVTWTSGGVFCLVALALGAAGGAIGGILIGGKHIGFGLSAMMGMFFGPVAALPGVLAALLILSMV
jgi:hypothetical protein